MESLNFLLVIFVLILFQIVILILTHFKEVVNVNGSKIFKYKLIYKRIVNQYILLDSNNVLLNLIGSKVYYLSNSFMNISKNKLLFTFSRKINYENENPYILISENSSLIFSNYRIYKYLDTIDINNINLYTIFERNYDNIPKGKEYFINYISRLISLYNGDYNRLMILEGFDGDIVFYKLVPENINYLVVDYISSLSE